MESKKLKLDFEMNFSDIVDLNKSFAKAKCLIAYCGRNRNKSDISEETFTNALSSIKNIPIVARYDAEKDDFGGHDIRIVHKDDSIQVVNATVPFGVVPESANQWFEEIEVNGETKKCLFTDVLLWKRQYGYEHIVNSEKISQSMEINVSSYIVDNDGYCIVEKMEFEALTLLGENIEPCFENACLQMYSTHSDESINEYARQFSLMIKDLKEVTSLELEFCNKKDNEGGKILGRKEEILKQYSKTIEDLDFSIDELSDEEFETKMSELFKEKEHDNNKSISFSATYRQKREALRNALDPIVVKDNDGNIIEETYFYIEDLSDEYVFVEKSHWTQDNYECKYGRYTYTFDEATLTATITGEFEEMVLEWLTLDEKTALDAERANYEKITTEYEEYKTNHSVANSEVEELKTYKFNKETEERKLAVSNVLNKFADIKNTDEYKELIKDTEKFSLKELEKECVYIRGLHAEFKQDNENKVDDNLKFSVEPNDDDDNDVYGGVMKKYLKK
jgi:hypothetical protein